MEQVAEKAGVSLATVNRVLNGRSSVKPSSVERVEAAIRALDYHPDRLAARLAKGRDYRFCFVLPEGDNSFMRNLAEQVKAHANHMRAERVTADIQYTDIFDPPTLAKALLKLKGFDGVAVVALDHPMVREAINTLTASGTAVVTLVSDVPGSSRSHFVGIDNAAAGRTAATLLGRSLGGRPGSVGIIAGSLALRDHAERNFGFTQVMQQEYPSLKLLPVLEGHDSDSRNEVLMAAMWETTSDLVGLYDLGAGTNGIIRALHRLNKVGYVSFVAHELNAATRQGLLDGTIDAVIAQDPGHEIRSAIRVLMSKCDQQPIIPAMERIAIDIYVRDNLP
jgi:LacI family transcriptional regulator